MVCTTDHVKKREEYHKETHNVERLTFDQILPLCNRFSNGKKQDRGVLADICFIPYDTDPMVIDLLTLDRSGKNFTVHLTDEDEEIGAYSYDFDRKEYDRGWGGIYRKIQLGEDR